MRSVGSAALSLTFAADRPELGNEFPVRDTRACPAIPRSAARRSDRRLAALSSSAVTPPQLSSSALPTAARPPLATSRDYGTRPSYAANRVIKTWRLEVVGHRRARSNPVIG